MTGGRGKGSRARERLDDHLNCACNAEHGLVFVGHGEATDKGGGELGSLRGRRGEAEGVEVVDGVEAGEGLFEVGVEGEVEEDGEGGRLEGRGGFGEGEDGGDGMGGVSEETAVVGADLCEDGEGLEGMGLGFGRV